MSNKLIKDFRRYNNTVFRNLNGRQLLSILIGIIVLFVLLMCKVPQNIFWTIAIILAALAVAIGWVRPYGVPIEQYLLSIMKQGPKTVRLNKAKGIVIPDEHVARSQDKTKQLRKVK